MDCPEIIDAIPHRDPFLFVDEILERSDTRIVGAKTFTGREWFFAGHYPDYPLVPGVLLCEAAMQCGAILLARFFQEGTKVGEPGATTEASRCKAQRSRETTADLKPGIFPQQLEASKSPNLQTSTPKATPHAVPRLTEKIPVATRMADVRFKRMVRPGERIVLEVDLVERLADVFFLKAKATVEGKVAVRFEFACTAAEIK